MGLFSIVVSFNFSLFLSVVNIERNTFGHFFHKFKYCQTIINIMDEGAG